MTTLNEPYIDMLRSLIALRRYVKIFYSTDLNELLSVTSIMTNLQTGSDGGYVVLASGESIRVDRLVNVNGVYAPGHEDYESCLNCRI
jgi:Rho-binding antiterminator